MKRPFLFLLGLTALSLPSFGQVTVELVPTSGAATVGSPDTFDIEVSDTTGSVKLDSYEFTLVPETSLGATTSSLGTATFALPASLASTFTLAGASGDTGGAYADLPADDLTISTTPTVLLTATFTPQALGAYQIAFASTGGDENLYTSTPSAIPFSTVGTAVVVAPEPSGSILLLSGLLVLTALAWRGNFPAPLSPSRI